MSIVHLKINVEIFFSKKSELKWEEKVDSEIFLLISSDHYKSMTISSCKTNGHN